MDEPQKKLSQRHEGRPRKVRFKISSAYSGRVLKQVFEDGQELEPPAKESSRRRIRHSFEPEDHLGSAAGTGRALPLGSASEPRGLQRLLCGRDAHDTLLQAPPILDFGKIIIYTNNLKIIRAPMDQKELVRRIIQTEGMNDWAFKCRDSKERFSDGHRKDVEMKAACSQYMQRGAAERACPQCRGSGSAPCSLCHGSKFSMLANRFKESYRALRCPAC
ncbi:GRCR2 protein, partial [Nothocercus nigrocapillus]|nr:GRCR2 protein [Nothocercus nigrocapillus]